MGESAMRLPAPRSGRHAALHLLAGSTTGSTGNTGSSPPVVSLAGRRPVGGRSSSRCPAARRCCWSRSAQPCLAPRSRHRQGHPTVS